MDEQPWECCWCGSESSWFTQWEPQDPSLKTGIHSFYPPSAFLSVCLSCVFWGLCVPFIYFGLQLYHPGPHHPEEAPSQLVLLFPFVQCWREALGSPPWQTNALPLSHIPSPSPLLRTSLSLLVILSAKMLSSWWLTELPEPLHLVVYWCLLLVISLWITS